MLSFAALNMQFNSYILNSFWAMAPEYQAAYRSAVVKLLKGETVMSDAAILQAKERSAPYFATANGGSYELVGWSDRRNKVMMDELPAGSVAITPFTDAIMKYDQECGPDGVVTKMRGMMMADNHPNIKAHLIKLDSGGGEGMAMLNTNDFIKSLKKPTLAFVDDAAYSAAMGIATSANYIVANRAEAGLGSIGTMASVLDDTEFFNMLGLKWTDVYADASVDKNGWFRAAMDGNMEPIKAELNKFNNKFIQLVETNRAGKLTADHKAWGTGKVFSAEEALSLGLIDGISNYNDTINSLLNN